MEYATLKSGVEMSASAKKKPVADDGSWEENEAKMFAFWAIVVATMAVIIAAVTLPALYTSAHYLRSEIAQEADFCRMQVRDFWHKALELRDGADDAARWIRKRDTAPQLERRKRGWLFGHFVPSADGTAGQYDNSASDPAAAAYGGVAAPAPSYGGASAGYDVPLVSAPSDTYGGGGSPPSGPALASPTDRFGIQVLREYGNIQPVSAPDDSYAAAPILSPAFPPSIAPPASAKATQAAPLRRQQPAGCGCQCQMGPPGPPGPPGDDGTDGEDGAAGASGDVGRDGTVIALLRDAQKKPCVICPVGPPGVVGPQGPRGPTGPRGTNGISGIGGRRGEPGMQGPPGPAGAQGPIGPQGPKGVAGRKFMRDGTRGPVGKPGPPGPKGLPGCQGTPGGIVVGLQGPRGDAGRPGRDGHKGVQGPNGTPGAKGASGDCAHCPIPRTPPGY